MQENEEKRSISGAGANQNQQTTATTPPTTESKRTHPQDAATAEAIEQTIQEMESDIDKVVEKDIHRHFPNILAFLPHRDPSNINKLADDQMTRGQKIADWVAATIGSWRFILIQSTFLTFWIIGNQFLPEKYRWDVAPFILLNLMLSFQAAYSAPFIMMSQNRQASKDRLGAEEDFKINIKAEEEIKVIMTHLTKQDELIVRLLHLVHNQQHMMMKLHTDVNGRSAQLNPKWAERLKAEETSTEWEQAVESGEDF